MQNNGKEMNKKKKACQVFFLLIGKNLACVAGVRKGRGRELGRETARVGGGRRGCQFPLPLLTPTTHARKKCVARSKFFLLIRPTEFFDCFSCLRQLALHDFIYFFSKL